MLQESLGACCARLLPSAVDQGHFDGYRDGRNDEVKIPHEIAPICEEDEVFDTSTVIIETAWNEPAEEVGNHEPAEHQVYPLPLYLFWKPLDGEVGIIKYTQT